VRRLGLGAALAVFAVVAILAVGCHSKAPKAKPAPTRVPDAGPDESALAKSNNAFALDLYAKLREQKGNLFLSPYSISSALAMTYAGARGQTAAQMAKAMHFDLAPDRLHAAFSDLAAALDATAQLAGCDLLVANALWAQKGDKFLKEFLDLAETRYSAKAEEVDFQNAPDTARKTINHWAKDQTRDKVRGLIPKGDLDPQTRLVLTNAVYFKGVWDSQFQESSTKDASFTLLTGEKVKVPMMHRTHDFGYAQANGVQVLELPYKGQTLAMVILLPTKADGLPDLEKSLTAESLAGWLAKASRQEVVVSLLKFSFTVSFKLNDALKSIGMPDAFAEGKADFSGMNGKTDLFISAVLHKTFVDVSEKGTEAAAATAVKMETKEEIVPVEFRADHPFLFLIRHNRSGAILFLGRVVNPKE